MIGAFEHLLQALAFLLFTAAPLPLCSIVAARWRAASRNAGLPQTALVVLVVWCVAQGLVAHLLGVLHLFRFAAMVALELLLLAGGALAVRRSAALSPAGIRWPQPSILETVLLVALAAMGLTLLWWVAAMPVVDWDSWAFHLPTMIGWLESGTFTRMAQYAERPRNSYPYGWEAICALFLTPFDEDMLVAFPNLVAWILLGTAAYALARAFAASRTHALACTAMLLAIRAIVEPIDSMHVDVCFAALFLAACFFAGEWMRRGGDAALGLGAAALGLSCATRTTGPFYAIFLLAWMLLLRMLRRGPTENRGTETRILAATGILAGAALGGFWWLKNLVELGHPLGSGAPIAGDAATSRTWAHYVASTLADSVNPFAWSSWRALYDRAGAELGLAFAALACIALLWPLAWARGSLRRLDLAPAALTCGALALFWITPLGAVSGIQMRLGFPFVAALAVLAAVIATRVRLRAEITAALAVISAIACFGGSRVFLPFVAAAVSIAVLSRVLGLRRHTLAIAAIAFVVLVAGTMAAKARREVERGKVYDPAYGHLEHNVAADEPVAYFGGDRSYLLYGRHLRRRVLFAPKSAGESARDWSARLRRQSVGIVAVGPWYGNTAIDDTVGELIAAGAIVPIFGRGDAGEVTLYRLRPMDSSDPID